MIAKAVKQLTGESDDDDQKKKKPPTRLTSESDDKDQKKKSLGRWVQIKYLENYFKDEGVKTDWEKYWTVERGYIDNMLKQIYCDELKEEAKKRSFICLFDQHECKIDKNNNFKFSFHDKDICKCDDKGPFCVKNCIILTHNELKNFKRFKNWWKKYFSMDCFKEMKTVKHELKIPMFKFLLNRLLLSTFVFLTNE